MLYHVVKAPETLSLINPFLHLTSVYSSSLAGEPHQVGSFDVLTALGLLSPS